MPKGEWKLRKVRSARACKVCRMRKVRCDAEIHVPCTNCISFGCECQLAEPRKRRTGAAGDAGFIMLNLEGQDDGFRIYAGQNSSNFSARKQSSSSLNSPQNETKATPENNERYNPNEPTLNISSTNVAPTFNILGTSNTYTGVKPSFSGVNEFYYLGPSSAYDLIMSEALGATSHGAQDHEKNNPQPLPIDPAELNAEIQILTMKGSFHLPLDFVCHQLFDTFFQYVHPQVPIVNKQVFLAHFNDPDPNKRPPLILIQAILLVGAKFCRHPSILDANNSTSTVVRALFQRVRTLYESTVSFEYVGCATDTEVDEGHIIFNYPTVIVQTLCLLSWYDETPDALNKSLFLWLRNALSTAQTYGIHRNLEELPVYSFLQAKYGNTPKGWAALKKLAFVWRKLWWWMITRDRSMALSYGRPLGFELKHASAFPLHMADFQQYEGNWSGLEEDTIGAEFFIHTTRLAEIQGLICNEELSVRTVQQRQAFNRVQSVVRQCNLLMGAFFRNLPSRLKFLPSCTNKYACIIGVQYYITLYRINRLQIGRGGNNMYWGILFQAIYTCLLILQTILDKILEGDRPVYPAYMTYAVTLVIFVFGLHIDSNNELVATTLRQRIDVGLRSLQAFTKVWPSLAKMTLDFLANRLSYPGESDFASRFKHVVVRASNLDRASTPSKQPKLLAINFLLNDTNLDAMHEKFDDPDQSLPIYNLLTFELPEVGSSFYLTFTPEQLFPSREEIMEEGPDHLPDLRMKMFDLGELYDGSFLNMDSGIDWSELYNQT